MHVLPGLDDGARDEPEALEIVSGLAKLGYRHLVATPHADDGKHTYGVERIAEVHGRLSAAMAAAQSGVRLDFGAEYAYGERFRTDLQARRLITLGGSRHMLLELPENFLPPTLAQTLFDVGAAGVYPILAHPERCTPFHDHVERLTALASGRALIQVSFRSLAGTFGRTIKRTAWSLVLDGHADLVATDCHRPKELGKIVAPVLAELRERLPAHRFHKLTTATPLRLIAPT